MKAGNVLLAVIALALLFVAAYSGFVGIPYKDDIFGAGTKLIGSLSVVTLFVERSTAVLNSVWYGNAYRIAEARESLEQQKWLGASSVSSQVPADLLRSIEEVAKLDGLQDRVRMIAGFLIALVVSAAGVRTLESLQTIPAALNPFQLDLYHAVDVLITAGLIAGGSSGIHEILDLLRKYSQLTKLRLIRAGIMV